MPEQVAAEPSGPLSEPSGPLSVVGLLRRRFLAILIPVLIVPGVALALSLQQEKHYEASTSLLFRDSGPGSSVLASADPDREAATNLRLLQLGVLEDRVNARLKNPFTGDVDVVTEAESNLATITVTDTDPERAARMANEFAKEYIDLRQEATREEVEREREAIRNALSELPPAQQGGPRAHTYRRRLKELAVSAVVPSGARQVKPAEPPSSPSSPDPVRNTVIGGLIGLALGIAFAVWLERRDRRVRDPRDIEAVFGRPIIGRIPESRALAAASPGTTAMSPPDAEAFRTLRANLRHLLQERDARSTLVTSANPGDGKTTIAWNLARAEAASGARVLLVEADMRHPILGSSLGVDGAPGLRQLLTRDGQLQDLVQPIGFEDATDGSHSPATVDVLFAGGHPPNAAELLGSERMRAVIEAVSDGYDLVVLDTPPASIVSDAMPILGLVGGVVVVGRLGLSTLESITELRDQLQNLDAPTLGVVINCDVPNVYAYRY